MGLGTTLAMAFGLTAQPIPVNDNTLLVPGASILTWEEKEVVEYPCPDPSSGIDPMGQFVVVSKTVKTKSGSVTVSSPMTIYPDSKTCTRQITHKFQKLIETDDLKTIQDECTGKCSNVQLRDATRRDVMDAGYKELGITPINFNLSNNINGYDKNLFPYGYSYGVLRNRPGRQDVLAIDMRTEWEAFETAVKKASEIK